jgi:hypothetical protein
MEQQRKVPRKQAKIKIAYHGSTESEVVRNCGSLNFYLKFHESALRVRLGLRFKWVMDSRNYLERL